MDILGIMCGRHVLNFKKLYYRFENIKKNRNEEKHCLSYFIGPIFPLWYCEVLSRFSAFAWHSSICCRNCPLYRPLFEIVWVLQDMLWLHQQSRNILFCELCSPSKLTCRKVKSYLYRGYESTIQSEESARWKLQRTVQKLKWKDF